MSGQLWTITSTVTGEVLHTAFWTPSTGSHPKDNGWAWDAATQTCSRIAAQAKPESQSWNGTAWVEDAAKVEAALVAQVKAAAGALKAKVNTPGVGKSKIYAAKQAEVNAFYQLGGTLQMVATILSSLTALPTAERERRFRYALAEQRLRGESSIQPAIERFAAGAVSADREVARLEAIEQGGVAAIKAATTPAAKRAAFGAINWSWS